MKEQRLGLIPWLVNRWKNRKEIRKEKEIRELRLDIEKERLKLKLDDIKSERGDL